MMIFHKLITLALDCDEYYARGREFFCSRWFFGFDVVGRFGCIDTEQPDGLSRSIIEFDVDRIAIDDVNNGRISGMTRLLLRC